jgi:hypothetical protein
VGYENRHGRVLGGGFLILAGCFYAVVATAVSSVGAAVLLPLSILFLVAGARTLYANILQVTPPFLELRYTFHTRRVPLVDIVTCRPRTDNHSGRLRSEKTYPEIVLKDGHLIGFPLVQWLPEDPEEAAQGCEQIASMIRAAVAAA